MFLHQVPLPYCKKDVQTFCLENGVYGPEAWRGGVPEKSVGDAAMGPAEEFGQTLGEALESNDDAGVRWPAVWLKA